MHTAADLVERNVHETLIYYAFPDIHWQKIRTIRSNGSCERSVGVLALLVHSLTAGRVSTSQPRGCNKSLARQAPAWSAKCYMNMRPLYQPQVVQTEAVA